MNIAGMSDKDLRAIIAHPEHFTPEDVEEAKRRLNMSVSQIYRKIENPEISTDNLSLGLSNGPKVWWFEESGSRLGPFSEEQIIAKLQKGDINQGTLVWKPGMDTWHNLGRSGIMNQLKSIPPPLDKSRIADHYLWLMVFWPIIWTIIQVFVQQSYTTGNLFDYGVPFLCLSALILLDCSKIKAAGYSPPSFLWIVFLPWYIYKRQKTIGLSQAPTIVHVVVISPFLFVIFLGMVFSGV